jgi:hypothetical protein
MSIFDILDEVVSETVDAVNEIAFIFTPMKATPNGRPGADPDRDVIEGAGIFDYVIAEVAVELGNRDRRGNDLRALTGGSTPVLSIDRQYFPTTALEPGQGDRIEFPDRSDLPTFEIVSVKRDGLSRLEVQLVRA